MPSPMTAPFFTSYARLDDSDKRLRKTIDKVRELLRAKLGLKEPDLEKIGFFDVTNIENGKDWEKALAEGLRNSRVIVCMCSPHYLSSEYCAKEFAVFQKRLEAAGKKMEGKVAIVPVLWEPGSPPMVLPKAISRYFQQFEDRFPKAYGTDGLATLSRLRMHRDRYTLSLIAIAEIIANAYTSSTLKPWAQPVTFEDLPNFFHDHTSASRPYSVTLTALHPDKIRWRPEGFAAGIANLADAILTKSSPSLGWREIDARLDTLTQQLQEASAARQISVVIVDDASIAKSPWKEMLALIEQLALPNVIVLTGRDDDEATATKLAGSHTTTRATFQISDAATFEHALRATITPMYLALVDADSAARVESQELEDQAKAASIDPTSHPKVQGPGGKRP